MSTITRLLTAEDLWQLPADGNFHELVRGEIRTMPPAGFEHGVVGTNLALCLGPHIKLHRLGLLTNADTGFLLHRNPDTVRAPDIGFVRQERVQEIGIPVKYWPGAPDLAVEVVSPSDRVYEVDEKNQEWLEAGAALVWVVNPRQHTVTVHQVGATPVILTSKDILEGEQVLPGFSVRVADIFV